MLLKCTVLFGERLALQRVQRSELRMSSRIFVKFEMVLLGKSGAWEKMIQEKNLKQKKSRDTVP